ncbi:hypothetical protein [Rubritalea tangerina]|uniref:Amino acid permease n=1 Tax=Rubritalea tangerina TaxID=430798 RepID=A0ABW4ZCC6_9BACT
MMNILIIAIALSVAGFLAFSKKLNTSSAWRATLTPLASIMGSGFLVCAPLIGGIAGPWSLFFMIGLLLVAYAVGACIRFNIRHFEPIENAQHGTVQRVALASRMVLAIAYFISVAYYLQLLAVFVLSIFGIDNSIAAKALSSTILIAISIVGITHGLSSMERLEKYAISLNLGMICALLFALLCHNIQLFQNNTWQLPLSKSHFDTTDIRVILGLLIVVQGFETSRYLGAEHSPQERITTMRRAQWISSAIYIIFISLMTVLFHPGLGSDVTEVIQLTAPVAAVLPILLTVAAVGSQFSASVADEAAAGGLLEDVFKVPTKRAYLLVMIVSVSLTWITSVTEVISIASRAFAVYYLLQCTVAALLANREKNHPRTLAFSLSALLCLIVALFGIPAE